MHGKITNSNMPHHTKYNFLVFFYSPWPELEIHTAWLVAETFQYQRMNSDLCFSILRMSKMGRWINGWSPLKKNQWERHDNEDCTVFHFFSMLGTSNCIKCTLDDASVLLVIDAARIGILARLNKLLYNIGLLSHSNTTSKNVTTKKPNVAGVKKQSIERMVSMVQKTSW